jgi:hypothetical protein
MNYEALGQYHHLKDTRQNALRKLHILGKSVVTLGHNLDNYRPPYPGIDNIAEDIANAEVAIAEIKLLVKQVDDQWQTMERIRNEYNLSL